MAQKQVEIQKLLEQKKEKEYSMSELEKLLFMQPTQTVKVNNPLSETMKSLEKELNRDIYSSDKEFLIKERKEKKKYSSTKVKARNFLTNISYNSIKNKDYENKTFVIDIFAYLILYFNPYSINGKFETEIERTYVNILWSQLLPQSFYTFVSKKDNIQILNKKNAKFQDAVEIVKLYTEIDSIEEDKYSLIKNYLRKYLIMYQFIFSNLFPKYYGKFNNRGIKNNIEFNSIYDNYLKETTANWQKNEFLEALPFPLYDEESDNENHKENHVIEKKKKNTEEEKKQRRMKRKLEMQKQKEILEEKLKENTEKLNKIKKM